MSWEAWSDDGAGDYDHLLDAGWWPSEIVDEVKDTIHALVSEPVYDSGDISKGISVRFLARLTLLRNAAEMLQANDPLVVDAKRVINGDPDDGIKF